MSNPTLPATRGAAATLLLLIAGNAASGEPYQETRAFSVEAEGVRLLEIDVGAGALDIRGDDDAKAVRMTASLWIEDAPADEERVRDALDRHVDIELERQGERIRVMTVTRDPGLGYSVPHVDVTLVIPSSVDIELEDGAGRIRIVNLAGNLEIEDGSGSIELEGIGGHVAIDDASGAIDVVGVAGRVGIDDESGSIVIREVDGDLAIDDGSGSITVRDVKGSVTIRDGSGSILVAGVGHDLHVLESGSGSVSFIDVAGEITVDD